MPSLTTTNLPRIRAITSEPEMCICEWLHAERRGKAKSVAGAKREQNERLTYSIDQLTI